MTRFIKNVIGPDERLIMTAHVHWVYVLMGLIWFLIMAGIGLWLDWTLWYHFGSSVPFAGQYVLGYRIGADTPLMLLLSGTGGAVVFLVHLFKKLGTEIALTSQRIIYKTGLIFVDVEEIDLVEIRAEHVHHGILGRFLGYGRLRLDSRFVGDIWLPAIRHPYNLVNAMHSARTRIHDPMDSTQATASVKQH